MDEPRTQTAASIPTDPTFGNGRSNADQPEAPADAFGAAMSHVAELKEFASHFVAAKLDGAKLTARRLTVFAALGVVALLVAGTVVITATVLLLQGLAQAIGAAFNGRVWAGNLIVGFLLLTAVMLGTWLVVRRMFNASKKQTVERYERRLQRQRVDLGTDARQRSAEQAAEQRRAR